jgi:hypothetical protein
MHTYALSTGASPEIILFLLVDFLSLGSPIISRLKDMLYTFSGEEARRIMS